MPPCLQPVSGIKVYSGDTDFYKIEYSDYATLSTTLPGDATTANYDSTAVIATLTGVSETDQTYRFSVALANDIPMNGYWTLYVPTTVGMPSNGISGLTLDCELECTTSDITLTYTDSTRLLLFGGAVPSESDYKQAPARIIFTIKGFTNPSTADTAYFVFTSYTVLSGGTYMIDQINTLGITAVQGTCSITNFAPTDGNYKIYGLASSWTATLSCEHVLATNYGVRITLPTDFYVIETSKCAVGGQNALYTCSTSNSAGTITIMNFLSTQLEEN
jgi:hypothetical protein